MNKRERERTPLSPSPSPEPPEGSAGGGAGGAARAWRAEGGAGGGGGNGVEKSLTYDARTLDPSGRPIVAGMGEGLAHVTQGTGAIAATGAEADSIVDPAQEMARRTLEERIRVVIEDLMQLATCAAEVHQGDEAIVRMKLNETMESLQVLQDATNLPDLRQMIPEDVMGMIDAGRNPDIHTRTFTNRLNSDNQQMRGQANNLDRYRDRLRDKLDQAFPEMHTELETLDRKV